jgi:hypothetical protein
VVNRRLGNFLRSSVTDITTNGIKLCPKQSLCNNDSFNRRTIKIPFQIVYGMHPRGISELRELG